MKHEPPPPSPFEMECRRLLAARLGATTTEARDDAEWAMEYLFAMHRAGRLDEYFANRAERSET